MPRRLFGDSDVKMKVTLLADTTSTKTLAGDRCLGTDV